MGPGDTDCNPFLKKSYGQGNQMPTPVNEGPEFVARGDGTQDWDEISLFWAGVLAAMGDGETSEIQYTTELLGCKALFSITLQAIDPGEGGHG